MKVYRPNIGDFGYRLGATEELREALKSMGFNFVRPSVNRGCHWGTMYFFDNDLELALSLMDPADKHFRIDTETRYFYMSPYSSDNDLSHWQFSIQSNKPREYNPKKQSKRNPFYKLNKFTGHEGNKK